MTRPFFIDCVVNPTIYASEIAQYKKDSKNALTALYRFRSRRQWSSIRLSLTRIFNRSISSAAVSFYAAVGLAAPTIHFA